MPSRPRVRLRAAGNSHHSHQVIAGYLLLASSGTIDLTVDWTRHHEPDLPSPAWILAEVDGLRLAYDTDDGDVLEPGVVDPFVDTVDVVWRRSLPRQPIIHYRTASEHRPLGLNYHATLRTPYFWSAALRSNRGLRRLGALALAERDRADRLQAKHLGEDDGSVLFQTRLWDPIERRPDASDQRLWSIEQRDAVNRERIALLRSLREEFGGRFRGGLSPSPLADRLAPDLVLSRAETSRGAFLRAASRARVCVTSRGLWDSNGWKLAEFLGLGRAIVAQRPLHVVPALRDGDQFLGFGTIEEALAAVRSLDVDPARRRTMQYEARRFFESRVEPAALVRRTLEESLRAPVGPGVPQAEAPPVR